MTATTTGWNRHPVLWIAVALVVLPAAQPAPKAFDDQRHLATDGAVRIRLARFDVDSLEMIMGDSGNQLLMLHFRPWPSQSCRLELPDWQSPDLWVGLQPNQWTRRSVEIPADALADANFLSISVTQVRRDPEAPRDRRDQRIGLDVVSALE